MTKSEMKQINSEHRRAIEKRKKVLESLKIHKEYYNNHQWSANASSMYNEPIVDNMIFKTITTILPAVFIRNPHVYVMPRKRPYNTPDGKIFNTIEAASLVEILLNYYIEKLQLKRELRRSGLDASLGGPGYIQCGYDITSEIIEGSKKDSDGEEEGASDVSPNELIKEDSPWFVRRSLRDILIDSNCTDHLLNDAEWVAFRVVKRLADVKADKSLKNTKDLDGNYTPGDDDKPKEAVNSMNDGGNARWLEYWVRYDKRRNSVITYVEDAEKPMAETDWPIKYDGFPVEVLYWNENPDQLFPMSDVELMIHQQDFLNRLESLQLDHVRRISSSKYVATEGSIDENEMLKLTQGPSGTIAYVKTSPPNGAIAPLQDNAVSQDQYIMAGQVKNNIRETLGVAAYESGTSQKFDTAAEPELIQQGINIKRDDRKDMVSGMWKRVMKKLLTILQQTMDKTEIPLSEGDFNIARQSSPSKLSSIVGADGTTILLPFLNISSDDIQGEYDFSIDIGSEKPDNEATRRTELVSTFSVMTPQLMAHVDIPKLVKYILKTGLGPVTAAELQRDPNVVAQEQQQAAQQQFQQALQLEQIKHQIPGQTKEKVAGINSKTNIVTAQIQAQAQKEVQHSNAVANQSNAVFKAITESHNKDIQHAHEKDMASMDSNSGE